MSRPRIPKKTTSARVMRQTWQSTKSTSTRLRLIQAAVASLAELGYAGTSIATIAARARVSRGAMQFHFPTKGDAMRAVIRFIFERRVDMYREDFSRAKNKSDLVATALRAYWKQVTRPEFVAHQALSLAARTDPEIRDALAEAHRLLIAQTRTPILERFPEWKNSERYYLAADIAQYTLDGMAWAYIDGYVGDAEVEQRLKTLEQVFTMIVNGPNSRAVRAS